MAKQLVTDAGVIRRPGAYSRYTVQTAPAGLATTGVLMLVGEASGGQHWSEEEDIEDNAFGPDQLAEVSAKYGSGPLVDAFRGAISASNDPDIIGSFSRAILVKTNTGTKASGTLTDLDGSGTYVTLYDSSFGARGNQNQFAVASAVDEVVPTTGSFTYIPAVGTVNANLRVNGGAAVALTLAANRTPTLFVSDVDALAGVDATGGVDRAIVTVSGTVAVAVVSGNTATFTRSIAWATTPTAGDTLVIPSGSVLAGAGNANVGAYVITSATSLVITATKLSDAGKAGAVIGTITAPLAVGAAVITSTTADIMAYSPVTISLTAGAVIQGAGKALEIAQLATGTDLLDRTAFELGTTTAVDWVSTVAVPALLTSGAESEITLTAARTNDGISESYTQGGEIPLRVGYTGGANTLTITETHLTTSLGLSLLLSDYSNVQALADRIASVAGYSASVGTAALGLQPVTALDRVSAIGITSEFGTIAPGRIKMDAYRLFSDVSNSSQLIQFNDPAERAEAGLPAVTSTTYLSGGATGGTTNAMVSAAIAALENVSGNFLIPLFSQDATADIIDEVTDATSTYTIAAINAAAKSHVLAMSKFLRRKSRQAINSIQASFQDQQDAAANTASYRVNMTFQNVKDLDSTGEIVTFQPWMAAVKAGSMQSAGFYRPITNKLIDISGISHDAGDFNPKSDSNMEDALIAGLMPIKFARTGGWSWESDQTTYGLDDNFVFNSLQAVYCADTIALTTGQRMEAAFVGKSVSDVSAQVALTYLDQIMGDFLRLKLIAPSDDALRGYKNARIRINGNSMMVSVEIKLATGIDFIVIDFLVSPVQQSA